MTEEELLGSLSVPFRFRKRPAAIPGDLRIEWRVAVVVLIVNSCHGKRASMKQLHVLNWAMRTGRARDVFLSVLNGLRDPSLAIVRFEPALNRAVDFALGEGLLARTTTAGLGLTAKGQTYVSLLEREKDCLQDERRFLKEIKGRTTQSRIDALLEWRA